MITVFLWENPCYSSTMCSQNTLFPSEASIVCGETLALPSFPVVIQWAQEFSQLQIITSVSWRWREDIAGRGIEKQFRRKQKGMGKKRQGRMWQKCEIGMVTSGIKAQMGKCALALCKTVEWGKDLALTFNWVLAGLRYLTQLFFNT